jgi:acetate---CoA ligase (ADP-forming)
LVALGHLLGHARRVTESPDARAEAPRSVVRLERRARGIALLASGQATGASLLELLAEYGIGVAATRSVGDFGAALAAADDLGYPVVLKTDEPRVIHKSDVGGVLLGIRDARQVAIAYDELASRLGPRVLVCRSVPVGVELALGIVADPEIGPLLIVGAGGVLVELVSDREVALPPVSAEQAADLLAGLRVRALLAGMRGSPPADLGPVIQAICGLSDLAIELGDQLNALDINPLICGPDGAIAVDALAIPRAPEGPLGVKLDLPPHSGEPHYGQ